MTGKLHFIAGFQTFYVAVVRRENCNSDHLITVKVTVILIYFSPLRFYYPFSFTILPLYIFLSFCSFSLGPSTSPPICYTHLSADYIPARLPPQNHNCMWQREALFTSTFLITAKPQRKKRRVFHLMSVTNAKVFS